MNKRLGSIWFLCTVFFTVVLLATGTACSARRTTMSQNNSNNQGGNTCTGSLFATMLPVSGSLSNVTIGSSVTWKIQAIGCTGKYVAVHNGISYPFTANSPALVQVTYPTARDMTEHAEVQSVNNSGQVLSQISVSSQQFTIGGTPAGCSVTASTSQASGAANTQGELLQPISFAFQLTNSTNFKIDEIEEQGVDLPADRVSVAIPTGLAASHSLQIVVRTLGARTFTFKVSNASSGSGQCQSSVVVNPAQAAAPTIISFLAAPPNVGIGEPLNLNLQATGNITGATIDGFPFPLNNGVGTMPIVPNRTGRIVANAIVTGPGGSSPPRAAEFFSHPKCSLQLVQAPSSLPGPLKFQVQIQGQFLVASIQGPTIVPTTIAGGNGMNQQLDVQMLASPAPVTLSVYGPDGTSGTCSGTAVVNPAPAPPPPPALPTISLTANGATGTVEQRIDQNTQLAWSSTGADSCKLLKNGVDYRSTLNGGVTSRLTDDTTFKFDCTNAGGTASVSLTVDVVGRWYHANYLRSCSSYCNEEQGYPNRQSPEGAKCASGRIRPGSAVEQGIDFKYGCKGGSGCSTTANASGAASSSTIYCVSPTAQTKDLWAFTVACFCGP